ncbi:Uncharacterised protein [uncultured archaeon]|nr:Uncharacterised protein [uncultured archaeon]
MDTFNFLLSMILTLMAIQFRQDWMVLGILVLSVLTSKDLATTVMFIIGTAVLYIFVGSGDVNSELWLPIIFGLVILSVILGGKQEAPQQDPMAGLGGFGGFGGGMEGMM